MSEKAVKWPASQVSAWLNVPATTCKEICARAGLDTKGGFDILHAGAAVVAHYKTQSEKASRAAEVDRARQQRAAADREELSLAKEIGLLVPKEDVQRVWEDGFAKYRLLIEAEKGLTQEQKERVLCLLTNVPLAENCGDE